MTVCQASLCMVTCLLAQLHAQVYAWGYNNYGQVGASESAGNQISPRRVCGELGQCCSIIKSSSLSQIQSQYHNIMHLQMVLSVHQCPALNPHPWPSLRVENCSHGATMEMDSWALVPMETRILHRRCTLQPWSLSR